jgi:hypothetical protein
MADPGFLKGGLGDVKVKYLNHCQIRSFTEVILKIVIENKKKKRGGGALTCLLIS